MSGSLSLRFDATLGEGERADLEAALSSHGASLASWTTRPDVSRTYAEVDYGAASPAEALGSLFPQARVDDPALVVLEVDSEEPAAREGLQSALGGAAAPVGIVSALPTESGLVVELDDTKTPLSLVIDLIDAELACVATARRVRPVLALGDRTLARLAGSVLGTRDLDESRFIETYAEPLLRGANRS